uniref:Uncharacterized protein n=1 Tax=Anopheles atroparvus TaxID=41427 RepID=A0AAG5DW68_ANOAO
MGNSGSMNGLASYEEGGYHQQGYHHHHQRYHDAMRGEAGASGAMSSSWMDSYQRGDHGRRGGGPRDYDYLLHMHEQKPDDGGHFSGTQQQQQQQQQQQIKVLPDIPGKVAKLRSTNNGNILHAGGTISKNNQALQRSKSISSPTYQQHQHHQQQPASFSECDEELQRGPAQPPRLLMTRSRTQLHMGVAEGTRTGRGRDASAEKGASGMVEHRADRRTGHAGQERYGDASPRTSADTTAALNHRKRFGSEPDLRLSLAARSGAPTADQQQGNGGGGARKPNSAQSKIIKGKNKKKTAPVPPLIEKRDSSKDIERQRIIAYSPLRKLHGDTNGSTLPSSAESSFNATATRKLRLFKTRAETKKTPTIAKLPEASDAKFTSHSAGPVPGGSSLMKQGPAGGFHPLPASSASPQLILAHHSQPPHAHSRQQQLHSAEAVPSQEKHPATAHGKSSPRPNPASFFRREKTFDAGLLGLERRRAIEPKPKAKPTMSPPLSRRKSIVKSLLEQEGAQEKSRKETVAPTSVATPQTAAITDFQKELQLMTRRKQSPEFTRTASASHRQQQVANKNHPAGASSAKSPFRVHVSNGGSGEQFGARSTPKGKPSASTKALVIPVQSEKECELVEPKQRVELPLAADARDSSPPATPPPPPPPPKTSFYFGMSGKQRQDPGRAGDQGDGSLPTSTNERLAEYFAERKAHSQPFAAESKVDDSDDPGNEDTSGERRALEPDDRLTPDEIGHTQMELIDQFAASLLNGSRFRSSDSVASSEADVRVSTTGSSWDDGQQEIALKLRPTLPRKQFDIPRFSPAAAWRLLTTEDEFCRDATQGMLGSAGQEDTSGEGMDKKLAAAYLRVPTFDQEFDVPEDRIQRVYREPVPGLQDNKSGDSGISGDAGLPDLGEPALPKDRPGDSTPEGSTGKQLHQQSDTGVGGAAGCGGGVSGGWSSNALLLMPWTPQQDLEDDDDSTTGSGSDAPHRGQLVENGTGDGRAGALTDGRDFSSKGHLFSLSLPRENHLSIYNVELNDEKVEKHMFNSLQKFRKSVSGAFKSEESAAIDSNDNWFLGRLGTAGGAGAEKHPKLLNPPTSYPSLDRTGREKEAGPDGAGGAVTAIAQSIHSSIGYLVSGKHMMYLPREPTKIAPDHHAHDRPSGGSKQDQNNNSRTYRNQNGGGQQTAGLQQQQQQQQSQPAWNATASPHRETPRDRKAPAANGVSSGGFGTDATTVVRREDKENLQDPVPVGSGLGSALSPSELENFPVKLSNRRNHRFTFQSTIRQIEKRRVAEKLSREAEIKEAMRLSELEAMRRVEEEFQKKRAREKASIRHQLRLFSMENHPEQQQQHDGHDDGEPDLTGDGKRSDPDGDSLPHQNANGTGGGRGLYRRREFTSMERNRQYRSVNGMALADGKNGSSAEPAFADFQQRLANSDDEEDHRYALEEEDLVDEGADNVGGEHDGDDGDSSSLGYVDTRTPYISRIIQAKSSKSYGARK